jgi:hypothetical protein
VQTLIRGFCDRGILSQLAPASAAKHRPATYRINEAALEEDPKMAAYRSTGQEQLPGVPVAAIPGEPIPDAPLVQSLHPVQQLHQPGAAIAPNSRVDSRSATLPNPPFQGGDFVSNPSSTSKATRAREASETPNDFHNKLTTRDRRYLNQEIYASMRDPRVDFSTAVETAAARLLIPLDDARGVVRAAGIDLLNKSKRTGEVDS